MLSIISKVYMCYFIIPLANLSVNCVKYKKILINSNKTDKHLKYYHQ